MTDATGSPALGTAASTAVNFAPALIAKAAKVPLARFQIETQNALDLAKAQNATKDATTAAAQANGMVLPPTSVVPNAVNSLLEGVAGKTKIAQKSSLANAGRVNDIARQELGLPASAPLSDAVVDSVIAQSGQVGYGGLKRPYQSSWLTLRTLMRSTT